MTKTVKKSFNLSVFTLIVCVGVLAILYFTKDKTQPVSDVPLVGKIDEQKLKEQINPPIGYNTSVSLGNLGPQLIDYGVIDLDKFKNTYLGSGQSLDPDLESILSKGTSEPIRITAQNSYFLLNVFWAIGLANKTKILEEGQMMRDGLSGAGQFASTGGWTLAKSDPMDYYSKFELIKLNKEQEKLVDDVSSKIYRPCCDNPTNFPDCNHGLAMLGFLELMAQNGANSDQMFETAKYLNAFWFPSNYIQIASYLENTTGKNFAELDGKIVLSKDNSSLTGYQNAIKWLTDKGLIQRSSSGGSKCSA